MLVLQGPSRNNHAKTAAIHTPASQLEAIADMGKNPSRQGDSGVRSAIEHPMAADSCLPLKALAFVENLPFPDEISDWE